MENLEPPVSSGTGLAEPAPEMPHSGVGIASFVMSLLATVGFVLLFLYVFYKQATQRYGPTENELVFVGLAVIACCVVALIALILGIVGLFQNDRRRIFAGFGVGISAIIGALIVFVIWFGLTQT
ncbi:MAG: hypothetical protein QNI99_05125 [Woeseiaceae bacterium]|nr:hypothetical protein [Woeseiaceae bacterium]